MVLPLEWQYSPKHMCLSPFAVTTTRPPAATRHIVLREPRHLPLKVHSGRLLFEKVPRLVLDTRAIRGAVATAPAR